jgi:PIN domain nuclease of toxin-antitoxin system
MILVDTHILVWYWLGVPALPVTIRDQLDQHPAQVSVSAMTIFELGYLIRKGALSVGDLELKSIVDDLILGRGITVIPVSVELVILIHELEFNHADPADRIIAATARQLGLPLATADRSLRSLDWIKLAF